MDHESVIFVGYENNQFVDILNELGVEVDDGVVPLELVASKFGVRFRDTYYYDEPWDEEEKSPVGVRVATCYRGAKELDLLALNKAVEVTYDKLLDIFGAAPKVYWGPNVS